MNKLLHVLNEKVDDKYIKNQILVISILVLAISCCFLFHSIFFKFVYGPFSIVFLTSYLVFRIIVSMLFVFSFLTIPISFNHLRYKNYVGGFISITLGASLFIAIGYLVNNASYILGKDRAYENYIVETYGSHSEKYREEINPCIKEAFIHSERLSKEDNAPNLPLSWRSVNWPKC